LNISITNKKYYREYDNSDNECCWQVSQVTDDIYDILENLSIEAELISDDWGAAFSWWDKKIEYSLMITCEDVDEARYNLCFEAFQSRLVFFNKQIKIQGEPYEQLVSDIRTNLTA
jgi:hypothetical protein